MFLSHYLTYATTMTHHLPHKNKYLHSTHPYLRSQDTFPVNALSLI